MILNQQSRVRVSISGLEKFRAYRGKNCPTDVLSFPADGSQAEPATTRKHRQRRRARPNRRSASRAASAPENLPGYLGDIAIAPAVARRNAIRLGRAFEHEMRILILHGMLHLLGYDHETDSGQMDRRENRLRRELGLL